MQRIVRWDGIKENSNESFTLGGRPTTRMIGIFDCHGERLLNSSAIGIAPMPYDMVVVVVVSNGGIGGEWIINGAECVWRTIEAMLAGESLFL